MVPKYGSAQGDHNSDIFALHFMGTGIGGVPRRMVLELYMKMD